MEIIEVTDYLSDDEIDWTTADHHLLLKMLKIGENRRRGKLSKVRKASLIQLISVPGNYIIFTEINY